MSLEHLLILAGIIGMIVGVVAAAAHPGIRRRIIETIRLLPHATRGERIMLCFGIGLLFCGPILIGPLDEIFALALIGRAAKRIAARRAV